MSHQHSNLISNVHPANENSINDVYPIGHDSALKKPARKSLYYNRFILPFQSLQFGAQSILFQINNVGLLDNTYLQFTLPGSGTVRANSIIGQNLITRIDYMVAGSQLISVSGADNFLFALDACEDTGKKLELIKQAGGDLQGQVIAAETNIYLPLVLPWSNSRACKKYPVDLSQLNSPVKVMIYLNTGANLYSANAPTALTGAEMVCKMGELQDQSQRLHLGDKILMYPHPFLQSFTSSQFTPSSVTANNTVYMSGFRSGSLAGLLVRAVDVANIGKTDYVFNEISDVIFRVNGVVVVQYDKTNYKVANLMDSNTACKVTINNTDYYYIHMNFTHRPLKLKPQNELKSAILREKIN